MVRALSRGPDGCGGRREAQEPRRGMKGDPRVWQRIRAERGEVADGRHARVFGMIGLDPGVLEPRDVDEGSGSVMQLDRTTIVIASEAKQSRSRRAPYGPLDRRVAPLLAMTIPSGPIIS